MSAANIAKRLSERSGTFRRQLSTIRVLYRDLNGQLWGIPYLLRHGQSPRDIESHPKRNSKRWIIGSLTDIRTYVSNANPGGVYGDEEATRALVEAIQSAKHPPYGTNWGPWLDANVDALLAKAVPPATAPTRSAHKSPSRRPR